MVWAGAEYIALYVQNMANSRWSFASRLHLFTGHEYTYFSFYPKSRWSDFYSRPSRQQVCLIYGFLAWLKLATPYPSTIRKRFSNYVIKVGQIACSRHIFKRAIVDVSAGRVTAKDASSLVKYFWQKDHRCHQQSRISWDWFDSRQVSYECRKPLWRLICSIECHSLVWTKIPLHSCATHIPMTTLAIAGICPARSAALLIEVRGSDNRGCARIYEGAEYAGSLRLSPIPSGWLLMTNYAFLVRPQLAFLDCWIPSWTGCTASEYRTIQGHKWLIGGMADSFKDHPISRCCDHL